ncbi:relaxase/mobilization nuclease domain-containing protein [Eilatimonas milleporae]|uniref:MobA/VirD2-like nuclease domain-containing protein n=1 Tax=Eilatimonas milleporae TaxID=911205 RepID=A0A3M0C2M4_9PROT|nr:relaxase [Eilatimonas milleporae]RMB02917.1 hypothetical protein BXY39_3273 [Eilatimonas milleporae]
MILEGNQRGGGAQLAMHLLKEENEHIDIHEIRGFIADDPHGAFEEAHAISKATKCRQYLFSRSLNPPQCEDVATPAFIRAADEAEQRLGLSGQPRAIVFHEKEGRRHAHVVWSRIALNDDKLKAINLPFYKRHLTALSKELYLEHGWTLPDGLKDPALRDPLNFSREEWQQALRVGRDPREIKQIFQSAWRYSDSAKAFNSALMESGFIIARGDRRGYVALDYTGEVYAIARYAGIRTKDVKARLGDAEDLPSIDEAKTLFAERITPNLKTLIKRQKQSHRTQESIVTEKAFALAKKHKTERQSLNHFQQQAWKEQQRKRQQRLRKGLSGLWARVTGKTKIIKDRNRLDIWQTLKANQQQRDDLIFAQKIARQKLQQNIARLKKRQKHDRETLHYQIRLALKMQGYKALDQERMRQQLKAKNRSPGGPELG